MAESKTEKILAEALNTERLYNQAPCGYITFTVDGNIIKINNTLLKWLGFEADEIVEKKIFNDLLSRGGQIHYEMFFRPMLSINGSAKELAYELKTKSGQAFHVLFGAVAIKDETGQIVAVNGIFIDNTDRKRYEQELLSARKRADSERQRLKNFFMQMPVGICVLDGPDLVFELINPLYQQFFPGRELLGKPLLEAIPEIKDQEIWNILHNVYETAESFEGKELLIPLRRVEEGPIEDRYFNFIYQARINDEEKVDGILVFVIEVTEMVNDRLLIQQSERNLHTLVMTTHYALMILRGDDYVVEIANQELANLWDKPLDSITGRKLLQILPELHDQPFPALLDTVFKTGIPYSQEEEILKLNVEDEERIKYVSFHYDPIFDNDGKVSGIIVAAQDITAQVTARLELEDSYTEQQAMNEELASINEELATTNEELTETQSNLQQMVSNFEESENRLNSVVESAPFPIAVYIGPEMRILLANQNIINVWGKGNDVIGKSYKELLPELAEQTIFSQLDDVYKTATPYHARNRRVDLLVDNSLLTYYFNYSFTPLLDSEGNVYGVMNTAADVTDLNIAKLAVERNEKNLNDMILQAPVAMCILVGPDHVIKVANKLMVKLWGKETSDVLNKPVFEALPDARNQGLEEVMAKVYDTGVAFSTNEMPVTLLRNGKEEIVYQNFVYEPFKNSEGVVVGVIAITIDVTEQVVARQLIEQSEKELQITKSQLEKELEAGKQVQRQKDGFIGMASHELKTPLTSLTAIIQVANGKLKSSQDPFLASAMSKANIQIKRMTAMINGFLNVSRLESGKLVIDKQRFKIEALIAEIIDEVQFITKDHILQAGSCGDVDVIADREKIGSVLSNFLTNAVKYSPKGTSITVNCLQERDSITVTVKDQGMGLRPTDLEKVFDRYYRVESLETLHIAGFGIGLFLSAEIIRYHDGKIWAESELGRGSTFCFCLPKVS